MSSIDRVEVYLGDDRLWYFRRVAANNEIVTQSEGYHNHLDAKAEAGKLFPGVACVELDRTAGTK